MRKTLLFIAILSLLALGVPFAGAQDFAPAVSVSDQVSTDGTVTIASVVSDGPGWLVVHAEAEEGTLGPVIGFRQVNTGENLNFKVPVDVTAATPTLYAMLHYDNSEIGVYEFDGTEGIDGPVVIDGSVVSPSFSVDLVAANDQFVSDEGTVTIESIVAQEDGWLVIHADNGEGRPGPVIGTVPIDAGTTTTFPVELTGNATNTLFPMLHVDTGEDGTYEFGTVEGADGPIVVNGQVATASFMTVPNIVASQQNAFDTFTAQSVLSDGPGWLVIHANNDGAPGEVLGAEFVQDGYNANITVSLNPNGNLTPVQWPMLHTDTGEEGVYEFGEVEGADTPVRVGESIVMFPTLTQPGITASDQALDGNTLTVATALIDAPGWLVVHADNGGGAPGAVIGFTPLLNGLNENVAIELDADSITGTVFPMLHYDTGEAGVYEFGSVSGADAPVAPDGTPLFNTINLEGIE